MGASLKRAPTKRLKLNAKPQTLANPKKPGTLRLEGFRARVYGLKFRD